MALIRTSERTHMDRNSVHDEIGATYTVFERDGRTFVQLDSYGREDRETPGRKSQTIQLDRTGAHALFLILQEAFHFE